VRGDDTGEGPCGFAIRPAFLGEGKALFAVDHGFSAADVDPGWYVGRMDVDCGSARDRLGRTLGGKYHLKKILGAGGTAVVYRATDPDGQPIAVKVLHDHLSRSEEVCRRFVREGQLGNLLDHPNTVKVLDHGSTEEGCPYLVLEYLEGESLEDLRVRAGGRLDMWETLDFCDQLLAVLEVAHAKSVIHRDIKPSNLFRTTSGLLKVLDFGIARITDETSATSTKTGQTVGTPAFMPPEQALSRPRDVDARTDIWSVGATLFTLLSGEHVHIAESSSEHLVKAATLHARSLARALPGVPANVEALVAKCLAYDKSERWESAKAMREELSFVRDDPGRRVGTSTSPPPERATSEANLAVLLGPDAIPVARPASFSAVSLDDNAAALPPPAGVDSGVERVSETNMSLVSNPGIDFLPLGRRRGWLIPAIALFLTAGVVGVVIALAVHESPVDGGAAAHLAASTATATAAPPAPEPAPEADPAPPPAVAAAPPAPSPGTAPAKSLKDPAVAPPPPSPPPVVATPPRPHPATAPKPASTPAVSTKKPPASRRDVYRPF
jgi:eukaryotic-like serine/threonine-protein kinase